MGAGWETTGIAGGFTCVARTLCNCYSNFTIHNISSKANDKLSRITRDLHIPRVRLHVDMEIMKSLWQYCVSSGQTLLPTSTCRVGGTAHWPEADADGSQQSPHPAELVQGGHAADPSSPGGYLRLAAGVTLGHTKWDLCRDARPLTSSPCQALLWECLT